MDENSFRKVEMIGIGAACGKMLSSRSIVHLCYELSHKVQRSGSFHWKPYLSKL